MPSLTDVLVSVLFFLGNLFVAIVQAIAVVIRDARRAAPREARDNIDFASDDDDDDLLPPLRRLMAPPANLPLIRELDGNSTVRWYTVFVGRRVGVFNSWYVTSTCNWSTLSDCCIRPEVQRLTSGVPGNTQCRYASAAAASAAFNDALIRGAVQQVDVDGEPMVFQPAPVHTQEWNLLDIN